MGTFWNFVFGIILLGIWVVSGGFITQTNSFITPYRKDDDQMSKAWTYSFIAAFITWFLVILLIILVILAIVGVVALFGTGVGEVGVAAGGAATAAEGLLASTAESTVASGVSSFGLSWVAIAFIGVSLVLVVLSGVLSAMTAQQINNSLTYKINKGNNPKLSKAYSNAIIAAVACLGAFGFLLIALGVYIFIGIRRKHKLKKQLEQEQIAEAQQAAEDAAQAEEDAANGIVAPVAAPSNITGGIKSLLSNVDTSSIVNTLISKGLGKIK